MTVDYVIRRIGIFLLVVWAAASINFFIPKLAPGQDPILGALLEATQDGGLAGDAMLDIADQYRAKYGLDQPLYIQYVRYMGDLAVLDLGVSFVSFSSVREVILARLPWTIGLLGTATVMGFIFGSFLGAFIGWPYSPRFLQKFIVPSFMFSAVPPYLMGLVLVWLLAVTFDVLPFGGGYQRGVIPGWDFEFIMSVLKHAALPAMALVVTDLGVRALVMRGTILSLFGEDYIRHAENRGLKSWRIFTWYGVRNALLPQLTWVALSLGSVAGGAIVVEAVFAYPGLGTALLAAIQGFDFPVVFGIVFLIILSIAVMTLLLDLIYPLIDPRIAYGKKS
jgi:peptide/nickel transport system permease protein